jgi:hypothetical protein
MSPCWPVDRLCGGPGSDLGYRVLGAVHALIQGGREKGGNRAIRWL